MNVLVLNCGSSSLKYQLVDMKDETVLATGLCERIGIDTPRFVHEPAGKEEYKSNPVMDNHSQAIKVVLDALVDEVHGVIKSIDEVDAVGHRVVHGGEAFSASAIITEEVKAAIRDTIDLAPLHNPANLMGIEACEELMPHVEQVAVFDTAFHQTMPAYAFIYAVPYEWYEKYKVRRYGFHGTSHKYVADRAASMLGKNIEDLNIVTCHLGNGASIAAVKGGKSVDTSMGFTPLEGLMMGTRSGNIDPAIITYMMDRKGLTAEEVEEALNKESGVLGISGVSSDFRDIEKAAGEGNERAILALEAYYYRVAKYIGSYAVAMKGVDAIVFTAGLGENSASARREICSYLGCLGVSIDEEKNNCRGVEVDFSKEDSLVNVLSIPTDEEIVIARDTKNLLTNK